MREMQKELDSCLISNPCLDAFVTFLGCYETSILSCLINSHPGQKTEERFCFLYTRIDQP